MLIGGYECYRRYLYKHIHIILYIYICVYIFLCTCAVLQKDTVFLLRLPLGALLVFKEITLHVWWFEWQASVLLAWISVFSAESQSCIYWNKQLKQKGHTSTWTTPYNCIYIYTFSTYRYVHNCSHTYNIYIYTYIYIYIMYVYIYNVCIYIYNVCI